MKENETSFIEEHDSLLEALEALLGRGLKLNEEGEKLLRKLRQERSLQDEPRLDK